MTSRDKYDSILTVANIFTIVRFFGIPLFAYLFITDEKLASLVLLCVLGSTDWFDGFLARRLNQISRFGQVVDPAVDRILLLVAGGLLIYEGVVPLFLGVLALARESTLAIGAIFLSRKNIIGLEVNYLGKTGALALMFSFPLFFAYNIKLFDGSTLLLAAAYTTGVLGLVFSWWSVALYFQQAKFRLKELE